MENRLGETAVLLDVHHAEPLLTIQLKHVPGIREVLQAVEMEEGALLNFQWDRAHVVVQLEQATRNELGWKEVGKEEIPYLFSCTRCIQQFVSSRLWDVGKVLKASETDGVLCLAP